MENKLIYITKAYSKINLGLTVYKKKTKENKHRLKSIFILNKTYYDDIKIYKHHQFVVKYYNNNKLIKIDNDIISKCVEYLKNKFKIEFNYLIIVNKKIPFNSGLGGSSTDGASIIKFILDLYNLKLSKKDYLAIALNISSDLLFFLSGYKIALVSKYGNKIKKINFNKQINISLILNQEKCNTKLAYEQFDLKNNDIKHQKNNFYKIIRNLDKLNHCIINNNLEPIVLKLYPNLRKYKKHNTLLCGSGSTFIKWGDTNES